MELKRILEAYLNEYDIIDDHKAKNMFISQILEVISSKVY